MKILIVEDTEKHIDSARETLTEHELTIARTFDEAMKLLVRPVDQVRMQQLLVDAGFPEEPPVPKDRDDKDGWGRYNAYTEARWDATKNALLPCNFDVVLTDMLLPPSFEGSLRRQFWDADRLVPYGFVIALRAADVGVRFVALATDVNHHYDPMSAAIDRIELIEREPVGHPKFYLPNFTINGARVMFIHSPMRKSDQYQSKDWGWVFRDLTREIESTT